MSDPNEVKAHAFFKGVDWDKMTRMEIDPPFRPRIKGGEDTANFDKIFTEERLQESLTSAYMNSQQLPKFDGFTYDQSPKFEITETEHEKPYNLN
jgi:serum/glucocorticoid-regulated kinase 2